MICFSWEELTASTIQARVVDFPLPAGPVTRTRPLFSSPRRIYTVYYRDSQDVQNADTMVTVEQVVTTEEIQYVDVPVAGSGGTGGANP